MPFKPAKWGTEYVEKPVPQEQYDQMVASAVASIIDEGVVAAARNSKIDRRPKLLDKISGRRILVDSGAARSIWPVADYPGSWSASTSACFLFGPYHPEVVLLVA